VTPPTLADVQAALKRGEIVVWPAPDGSVELLAARDPSRPAAAVTVVVLGPPVPSR
jgi:hypothetical protein